MITALISILLALSLIYLAFGGNQLLVSFIYIALALAAVWSAIRYTVGQAAYGYHGLGDLFVFLFFGWVSVVGAYYLQVQTIDSTSLFLGTAIGLLSVGVSILTICEILLMTRIHKKIPWWCIWEAKKENTIIIF